MRLLFYWRTKQKIRETRLKKCAARESQYAALHLLRIFCPKSGACRNIGGNVTRIACGNAENKKRRLPEHRGGNATQIACGNFERKSGACRNIGGNATQIAFGKYERKSGVCRNVWEDAKV